MGNICRSPLAERLLVARLREQAGGTTDEILLSHSCGLGSWHVGEGMMAESTRELEARGGDGTGFRSRQITRDMVEISDVILTATDEQVSHIEERWPDAASRTFLVRHFGALMAHIDAAGLPPFGDGSPEAVHARGTAIVEAADKLRDTEEPVPLDDPWGLSPSVYRRIADEIDEAVVPFVELLTDA